ncbi:MAG: Na+/H+ antiporter NhaA [Acidimicrobiales bacterium]
MDTSERHVSPTPGFAMPAGLRRFFRTEQAGAVVLVGAALVALAWANSPWQAAYASLWSTELSLHLGGITISTDVRHAVNEGLMALFFFIVGLEIKRELVAGELRSWRTAALPAIAALGGMVVPAVLYLAVVAAAGAGDALQGWGVPIATDIAFAVGVVALLGDRVPASLKLFLLSLAIVDDIGAIVVIAVFYSAGVDIGALAVAAVLLAGVLVLRKVGVVWVPAYVVVGTAVWLALFQSGVQAAIAGALLGLIAPATPVAPAAVAREWTADLSDEPDAEELQAMTRLARSTVSVAERLEQGLHPFVSFVVLPLFALANAGVVLDAGLFDSPGAPAVAAGVMLGLVVGKALGISTFSWLAVRTGLGSLPTGVGWGQLVGIGVTAGIGFTVSLLVAELAFAAPGLQRAAKASVLIASAMAALGGALLLRRSAPPS